MKKRRRSRCFLQHSRLFGPLCALNIPKEWSWRVALNYYFVYLIEIYKMSYRNICFLEVILRPILDLFWAILDLRVLLISPRSERGRLPSITFLFISLRSTKLAIENLCSSNFIFKSLPSPLHTIKLKSIWDVDVSHGWLLFFLKYIE